MKLPFRNISTAYILLVFILKAMALPIIVLQYNTNKDFIINNLCINRAKPKMQCNGSCHLSKQLAKSIETSDSQETKGSIKISTVDCFETISFLSFENDCSIYNSHPSASDQSRTLAYVSSIFHPPSIV